MKSIGELFRFYGSDKDAGTGPGWRPGMPAVGHTYGPVYQELLAPRRESMTALLEVGVLGGASVRAWRDWLPPSCDVYGLDVNLLPEARTLHCPALGVHLFEGDSRDRAVTDRLFGDLTFDVIVDDGGHGDWEQKATWENLWDRVKPGGVYVVEDIQWDESIPWFAERGAVIIDRNHLSGRWDDRLAVFRKE